MFREGDDQPHFLRYTVLGGATWAAGSMLMGYLDAQWQRCTRITL